MMHQVDTMPVVRYCPEVLFYTIVTHIHVVDLEVKVKDFEILC